MKFFSRLALGVAALGVLAVSAISTSAQSVSMSSLLSEMTDRDSVARTASPAFTLNQVSSHDITKRDPGDPVTWHSNHDSEQFIRTEIHKGRREWVIMDAAGPGAITRFWLPLDPSHDKQIIRFYLDGSPQPVIAAKYNDLLAGRAFVHPPFAFVAWDELDLRHELTSVPRTQRGVAGDLYLPIPFSKSIKVTLDEIPFYYIINYREYVAGTKVKSFSLDEYNNASAILNKTSETLLIRPELTSSNPLSTVPSQGSISVKLPAGPAAVCKIRINLDKRNADKIRSTVLEAEFDGEETVFCPVSELSGCGPRMHANHDWYRTVTANGDIELRFVMPYRSTATISLHNLASVPVSASITTETEKWKWSPTSMHFHASWRAEHDLKTRPMSDWNYLQFEGIGRYIGDTLSVWSPVGEWYGEGDERIYLNGDTFPAHIGTGTEDYYGYAWGMADYFSSPFISTPARDIQDRGNWRGYTTTSRLRLLDTIPVTNGFKFDMEIWNWADTKVDYAAATYWYALPGSRDNRPKQPTEAATMLRPVPPTPGVIHIDGAIECETADAAASTPGLVLEQQTSGLIEGGWSGGKQLFVQAQHIGDFVELVIPSKSQQPVELSLYATKSHDYGILRFSLNGKANSTDFDGYAPSAHSVGPYVIGTVTPRDGKILLKVEVVGTNPESKGKRYYFGLDCVTLKPAL